MWIGICFASVVIVESMPVLLDVLCCVTCVCVVESLLYVLMYRMSIYATNGSVTAVALSEL